MNSPRLVTHAGLTINLSQANCFRLNNFIDIGKPNTLVVEFKTRYDYIQHPETNEFEKQKYTEQTELEFPDYNTAKAYSDEWIEIWLVLNRKVIASLHATSHIQDRCV